MSEFKKCAKCGKILPISYEKDICEHCTNKKVTLFKKIGGAIVTVGTLVIGGIVTIITKKK